LLLPPSEGKAAGGGSGRWQLESGTFSGLAERRREIVEALEASRGGSEKLLGVKGEHLDRAQSANLTVMGTPTLPVWKRYTGVVWDHVEPASLSPADRRRIVVVSGLFGLLRGDDPVPDYRLKMSANLAPLGKLSTWWRDELSETLNRYATGRTTKQRRVLVDLLPQEHRAAWTPDSRVTGLSVELVDPTGKPGGHFAKAAKGELARAILTRGLAAVDTWRHDRFELVVTPIESES
jgi:cytoplasmic iron level regulating protein YaaA (DUF328/UPF0246 family)